MQLTRKARLRAEKGLTGAPRPGPIPDRDVNNRETGIMCHACVIESVKSRMLSRRSLFGAVGASGLGLTALGTAGLGMAALGLRAARAETVSGGGFGSGRVIDLTHSYDSSFPTFG